MEHSLWQFCVHKRQCPIQHEKGYMSLLYGDLVMQRAVVPPGRQYALLMLLSFYSCFVFHSPLIRTACDTV